MSGSVNKVILIGNVGADPEIRTTQAGKKIVNFRLAMSESWKDRQSGERRERTEWVRVVIMSDGLAGVAERFVKKGSKVYVEGTLRTRKWQDQSGQDRYTTEVVIEGFNGTLTLLDSRPQSDGGSSDDYRRASNGDGSPHLDNLSGVAWGGASSAPDFDDEIPF